MKRRQMTKQWINKVCRYVNLVTIEQLFLIAQEEELQRMYCFGFTAMQAAIWIHQSIKTIKTMEFGV